MNKNSFLHFKSVFLFFFFYNFFSPYNRFPFVTRLKAFYLLIARKIRISYIHFVPVYIYCVHHAKGGKKYSSLFSFEKLIISRRRLLF